MLKKEENVEAKERKACLKLPIHFMGKLFREPANILKLKAQPSFPTRQKSCTGI